MKEFQADLHVHTCLSPCAEEAMVPTAIVRQAKAVKLNMIAICDHNSAENVAAVAEAGRRESLAVIPGIEVTSREEVHILGLFDSERGASDMQEVVYANLPGENDEEAFGPQTVVDACDRAIGANRRLLIGATTMTLEQVVDAIHGLRGLAVAAHVDRESFGLIGQLGFVPPGLKLDALEVSPRAAVGARHDLPLVTGSDAHGLERIGTARRSRSTKGPACSGRPRSSASTFRPFATTRH
jgi:predicted metal-dependent phosphoesterase TrpH